MGVRACVRISRAVPRITAKKKQRLIGTLIHAKLILGLDYPNDSKPICVSRVIYISLVLLWAPRDWVTLLMVPLSQRGPASAFA